MNIIKLRKNPSDDELTAAVLELYLGGYHVSEIVKKLRCDPVFAYNVVTRGNHITDNKQRDEMIELRNDGCSLNEISKEVDRSRECVRTRLKSPAKVHVNIKEQTITDTGLKKLKAWYVEGKTIAWISRQLNISKKSITWRLQKCGLYAKGYSKTVPLTPKEKRRINMLRKKGYSVGDIAKDCGRLYCTVAKYLQEFC